MQKLLERSHILSVRQHAIKSGHIELAFNTDEFGIPYRVEKHFVSHCPCHVCDQYRDGHKQMERDVQCQQ